jgi:hypothetical protein
VIGPVARAMRTLGYALGYALAVAIGILIFVLMGQALALLDRLVSP